MATIIIREDSGHERYIAHLEGETDSKQITRGEYPHIAIGKLVEKNAALIGLTIRHYRPGEEPLKPAEYYGAQRIPVKGETLYIDGMMESYGHTGGRAIVQAVYPNIHRDTNLRITFEGIGMEFDYCRLERDQDKLCATYGDAVAEATSSIERRREMERAARERESRLSRLTND